jgi:hypothetical protein
VNGIPLASVAMVAVTEAPSTPSVALLPATLIS